MRLRALRSFLFLLTLSSLFVDVSVSISFPPAIIARQIPLWLRYIKANKWISRIWNTFKSLFKLKVLKVGEIAEGLSDVKKYLDLFGYLNSTLHSNYSDHFTLDLQSAVIEFQKNFNLNVTGELDRNTYNTISQPRCGVPDIINGTTAMNSGKSNTTSFTPWWKEGQKELTYAIHPQNNVTDGVKLLFRDAFNRWSKVTLLNFTETTSFNASDIRIAFVAFDGEGGVVGGADTNYSLRVGGIYLDSEEEWVVRGESEEGDVDLEYVVMHMVGHVLGLGHSSVEEAVMYPIVWPEKKTELAYDDLQRIHQIYGLKYK
ncbi:Metalloendoproteinase 5-MMP [Spatholobus suberectus]|nr:Metalloendoproteinase 5-MMP [Spatholobus suberectus]